MKVRAATGMSSAPDASDAGRIAAKAALDGLQGEAPELVVVYASNKYDLPALVRSIRAVTGDASLIGATTAGHFAEEELQFMQPGVAVLAMTSGPYRFGVASAEHIAADLDAAGQRLARESRAAAGPSPHGAVIVLSDWLIGDQQQLIHGIYRVTGPRIPTVGGAASDSLDLQPTVVFHDDRVLEQGAVAVWVASEHPLQVITRHGWEPVGIPLLVGRAAGTTVHEIGGQPARRAYLDQLGIVGEPSAEEFEAITLRHPIGILEADGTMTVRAIIGRSPADALMTIAPVPTGCAVQVGAGTPESLLGCVEGVARDAIAGTPAAGALLVFSCVARAQVCGDRIVEEPQALKAAADGVTTFGFYTYGEYGRARGVLGTHNATLTALAL